MSRTCCIFGAGEYGEFPEIPSGALVIAADGGYKALLQHGIVPDLLLGDFDSLEIMPQGIETIRFKAEKDATDMSLAIDEGIARGCEVFYIYGGTGGRLDHTVANIQCLARLAQQGFRGVAHGADFCITAITDGSAEFGENCRGYISVFSHSDVCEGVYERGLKYSLTDARLVSNTPLGVSNEFCGKKSRVSVARGTLVIIYSA